jgi:hypothetical protein
MSTAGVVGAVGVAATAGVGLHTFGSVDAMHQMLSDAVVTPGGAALLGVAGAALVVAAGFLAVTARHTSHPALVRGLLAVWAGGIVALVLFPTNLPGTEVTTAAVVHRWGAAIAVAVPPVLGLLVARSGRLRTVSLVTGAAAAVYGLAHLPVLLAGADPFPYAGLYERVLLALTLAVVVLLGAETGRRPVPAQPLVPVPG